MALAAFITTADNTVVNIALPAIRDDLGMPLTGLQWVVTAYVLTFSALMLAGGRLADVYGRKRALMTGMAIFTVASLVAALAPTGEVLIVARLVQGTGAAFVVPAALAILTVGQNERQRDLGAAVWMVAMAAALASGPVLGGWLSERLHWSWIFHINLPIGVATLALAGWAVPETRDPDAAGLDLPGLLTSGAALTAGTFLLIEGGRLGWDSPVVLAVALAAAGGGAAFVAAERRRAHPMIDLPLLRHRALAGGAAAQMIWGLGVNGVFFFTSLALQNVLHYSGTQAGMVFLPLAGLVVVVAPLTPLIVAAVGAHRTVATGLGLVAAGMLQLSMAGPESTFPSLLPGIAAVGIGSALSVPLTSSVLAAVPEARAGVAGGILGLAREVSGILGVGAIGVIVTTTEASAAADGADPAHAFTAGYAAGLRTAAALLLVGALIALFTLPRRQSPPPVASRAAVTASSRDL
ncbi:MAG TPA: MFS transporter [Thermomonospora sp.]|nr:MFS transporter [Thermomonospora sp.]